MTKQVLGWNKSVHRWADGWKGRWADGQIDKYFINPKGWTGLHAYEWSLRGGDLLDDSDLTRCQKWLLNMPTVRPFDPVTSWMMTWSLSLNLFISSSSMLNSAFGIQETDQIILENKTHRTGSSLILVVHHHHHHHFLAQRQSSLLSKQRDTVANWSPNLLTNTSPANERRWLSASADPLQVRLENNILLIPFHWLISGEQCLWCVW